MLLRFLVKWSGYFHQNFCHSCAGGNLVISLDPLFRGDDRKKHGANKNKEVIKNKILIIIIILLSPSTTPLYAGDKGYTCSLQTYNLDFGTFYPYDATFASTIGTVQVTCTANTGNTDVVYTISFSTGASGSDSARLIKNGTKTVSYNLYKDTGYNQILGTGVGSTYTFSTTYPLAGNQSQTDSFPIYGKIPVQPMAVPGFVYTDTITATLTY